MPLAHVGAAASSQAQAQALATLATAETAASDFVVVKAPVASVKAAPSAKQIQFWRIKLALTSSQDAQLS